MSDRDRKRLREIHTFPALVKYLREDLGWPVEQESFDDLDEITFDWEADELGIDPDQAAKIEYIKQLRPLENGQPQGVFFVKFNAKSLPVVALRRLLGKLVIKKRATAKAAERPLWAMRDLVFISSYGESEERQLSFAYFQEPEHKAELPTLRVLGWDDRDTALHLDRVHDQLAAHLTWPDSSKTLPAWRKDWSRAFELRHGEIVTTAKQLAEQLAALARGIRERSNQLLKLETETGPLRVLMEGFKKTLIHDLTDDQFADMYAQTIAYGLLSARITHPDPVKAETLPDLIPVTNPFLKELMETFVLAGGKHRGRKRGHHLDFDELGINDVVDLLRRANMDAVLRNFGAQDRKEDPVTYFYEDFLNAYDAQERKRRGVYYTPKPIVSFIVRSVHEFLQKEFLIEDGLASTVTWREMAKLYKDVVIPEGVSPDSHFVQILDPAAGTATFLVEVIEVILSTLKDRWKKDKLSPVNEIEAWNNYVPKHLLPRLYGYELMMAPYAIAHLKIGLKLFETGYQFGSNERVQIYLTNALEPASDLSNSQIDALSEALAHEAASVNRVKSQRRFTVVIGNPPYSGISSNRNAWIEGLLKGDTDVVSSNVNYYEANGLPLGEKKLWLQDDYVKFTRLSQFLLEQTAVGIHGMITNHSFVDSPTCRGMRYQMLKFYSALDIVDLHGSTKKGEVAPMDGPDENVFDILPGVAIAVGRVWPTRSRQETVHTYDLWGTRESKGIWLQHYTATDVAWQKIIPTEPYYLFVQRQLGFAVEYHAFLSLKDVFPAYGTGIQTSRDEFATDFNREGLKNRLEQFFDTDKSDREVTEAFSLKDTRGWVIKDVRRSSNLEQVFRSIARFQYRVFDERWIALCKDVVDWPRLEIMSCVGPGHVGLVCSRQQSTSGFRHVLAVDGPADMFMLSNKSREGQTVFPLYTHNADGLFANTSARGWSANIGVAFANALSELMPERGDAESALLCFSYVYAILYSSQYRERYEDLLKMDYPRVPLPTGRVLLKCLALLGGELVDLHLFKSPRLDNFITTYTGPKSPEVGRIDWSDNTIWLDAQITKKGEDAKAGTIGFRGVREAIWNLQIGSYQVCEKWLKDRKGRKLTKDDIEHYQKIVVAISETIRIMKEIDQAIAKHGGWPRAFQTTPVAQR